MTADTLDLSVLLATRDRAELLAATLRSLAAQTLPDGITWEAIVVDNGSRDGTGAVLAEAAGMLPLVALHEPRPGKNVALNQALDRARGRLLVFTDDDIHADPRWLAELHAAAARWPDAGLFAGRIEPRYPPEAPAWLRSHPFSEAAYARYVLPTPEGETTRLPFGPNFAVRASAMAGMRYCESIGPRSGGSYSMGSETELLKRLRDRGERIVYVPSAVVEHVVQPSQLDEHWLLARSFRLGRGLTRIGLVNNRPARRVWGVPRYLWPRLARTWTRYRLSPLLGHRRHFDIALEYRFLLGSIHEHRLMASEPRE